MKAKPIFKLLSVAVSMGLLTAAMTLPALAVGETQYEPVSGHEVSFNKILIVKEDAKIPNATFTFSTEPLDADIDAGTNTLAVYALDADVADVEVTFAPDDDTEDDDLDGYIRATQVVTIDLTEVEFPEPGVYRFYITEEDADVEGVLYDVELNDTDDAYEEGDGNCVRTLDVYVEDVGEDDPELRVTGYVMYKGEITEGPSNAADDATVGSEITGGVVIDENGIYVADGTDTGDTGVADAEKIDNIKNLYQTNDITFGKEVIGNQGSRDKFFEFTITVTDGVNDDDIFPVVLANAVATPEGNSATIYDAGDMAAANNVETVTGQELKEGKVFYLQDGNYITIQGLPQGCEYKIEEEKEDYTSTDGISAELASIDIDPDTQDKEALEDDLEGTINGEDIYTGFTNEKKGIIPTGILLKVTPVIVIGLVVIAGAAFFMVKNVRRKVAEAGDAEETEE